MAELEQFEAKLLRMKDGAEVSYRVGGAETDPAVVLLHGGGTDHALLSWREAIPVLLAHGYRVYAPDYPGYGDSPPDGKPSTLDHLQHILAELMDAWGLAQATLVGVSMGAGMALGYTLAHPERVRGLVLIGAYGIQDKAPFHLVSYLVLKTPGLMDGMWAMMRGWRWAAKYTLGSILHHPERRTEAMVDEVFAAMQKTSSQQAFGQFQEDEIRWNGVKTNYSERLSEIFQPVLLVHGSQDAGVPLKFARRAAERLPNARLEVFEGAGHWTQRDEPERFHQLLIDFLKEQRR